MPRGGERGAVLVFVALIVVLLVPLSALAVDLGMQRVVRRDMQALADLVALDLSRELDGRTQAQLGPALDPASTTSALSQSVARNRSALGDTPTVIAELGSWDGMTFDTSTDPPTAVRVTAEGAVDFAFSAGSGSASRSAIGSTIKSACYSIGSFAARFSSADSALISTLVGPMNELLRPQANLSAADYTGLASAQLSLSDLAAAAGLGSTDQLLTGTIAARQLITASMVALGRQASVNTVAISALDRLLKGQAELDTPVLLTQVVSVSPTDSAALQTDLSVLDLVTGTILLADGTHGLQLDNVDLETSIEDIAVLTSASLSVIEKPQIACGTYGSAEARAQTSQVSGTAQATLTLPTPIDVGGGVIVETEPANVLLTVNLGGATGQLAGEPVCNTGTPGDPDRLSARIQSGVATYSFATTLGFRTTVDGGVLGDVEISWTQTVGAGQLMPDQGTVADLLIPPNDVTPVSTGSGGSALGGATVASVATDVEATIKATGVPVPVATVTPLLQPLAASLATHANVDGTLDSLATRIDGYLTPLLTLLGLNSSGADVFAVGRPICGAPVLRG